MKLFHSFHQTLFDLINLRVIWDKDVRQCQLSSKLSPKRVPTGCSVGCGFRKSLHFGGQLDTSGHSNPTLPVEELQRLVICTLESRQCLMMLSNSLLSDNDVLVRSNSC